MISVMETQRWVGRSAGLLRWAAVGLVVAGGMAGRPLAAAEPDAAALYARHCLSCHGKDGRAQTPVGRKLGVKDLTVSVASDADMERQLREGTRDARGTQRMPPFKDKLTPAEVQALLGHVKGFRK